VINQKLQEATLAHSHCRTAKSLNFC